jgi:spore coat polysaccharide biosynthesis protein SpsF
MAKKKIVCLVQARMNSTRLPGKILTEINGIPMINLQINILKTLSLLDEIVVITTKNSSDDVLVRNLEKNKIKYFRGSENNVLERYFQSATKFNADIIIRITSDNPLIDISILEKIVNTISKNDFDYVSNNLKRTFPIGYDIEAFSYKTLKKIFETTKDIDEKEHVTLYVHKNFEKFKVKNIEADLEETHPEWRVTVDEKEDLELIREIFDTFKEKDIINYKDLIELFEKKPHLLKINQHVSQKFIQTKNFKKN